MKFRDRDTKDKNKKSKSKSKSEYKSKFRVKVSNISTFLFCQRSYYFKFFESKNEVAQIQALREIYFSRRMEFDNWEEWAKERFITLYGENEKLESLFNSALKKFKFSNDLKNLKSVDTEVVLSSEKLKLSGKLDELVFAEKLQPLILGTNAPNDGIWFNDEIKLAAFCLLLENERKEKFSSGYVYYCYSGDLRRTKISRRDKHDVIKAVERIIKIQNGFIPERKESKRCKNCKYEEICKETKETFASKFL